MTFLVFARVFVSTIMLSAFIIKLFSLKSFKITLSQLRIKKGNSFILVLIILSEVSAGIFLLVDSFYRVGASLVVLLVMGFLWAVYRSIKLNTKIQCNCFGYLIPETLGTSTVVRNVIILFFSVPIFFNESIIMENSFFELAYTFFITLSCIGTYALFIALSGKRNVR